jgi:hypothetical protein
MRVLRFQNKNGKGPYTRQSDIFPETEYFKPPKHRPGPVDDNGIGRYPVSNEVCAFLTFQQAYAWFDKHMIVAMLEHKIELVEIEAEVTKIGEYQVLCIPKGSVPR